MRKGEYVYFTTADGVRVYGTLQTNTNQVPRKIAVDEGAGIAIRELASTFVLHAGSDDPVKQKKSRQPSRRSRDHVRNVCNGLAAMVAEMRVSPSKWVQDRATEIQGVYDDFIKTLNETDAAEREGIVSFEDA